MNGSGGMGLSSSGIGSWVAEASPPPEGEGWVLGQVTWPMNSSMLIIGYKLELYNLCMMMIWPLCRLCNIANKVSKLNEEGPVETRVGTGKGVNAEARTGKDEAGIDGAAVEGATDGGISKDGRVFDLFPLALRGPLKVIEGSSTFHQFFFM